MYLYEFIQKRAYQCPGQTAIIFHEKRISYEELFQSVNRTASSLKKIGIKQGDRVTMLMPNHPAFSILYYAITAVGAVCVPANPLLKPAELSYIWGDSDVQLAFCSSSLQENVKEAQSSVASLHTIISIDSRQDSLRNISTLDELMADGSPDELSMEGFSDKDPALCIYTSGTTGKPKGALLSHQNLTINCSQFSRTINLNKNDIILCVLPLFHSFASTVCQNAAFYCGATTNMIETFHPARVMESIETSKVTLFPGVPAMFASLLHHTPDQSYDLSSLRLCVSGGAPMPGAVMKAFEEKFGIILLEGDGPTECSPVTSVNPLHGVRKPGSIGLPIPGVEMKIFDDNDLELPDDEIGEIVVRGENVMLGYHHQSEATAEAMRNGWYHTGDLGKRDKDGYFFIVDRKKDMMIVGGINVYPREIEERLYSHPAVADAAVLGMPSPIRGEDPTAIVVLKPGMQADARELIAYCREYLANFKVPRKIIFRDSLPHGGTGKILKRLLRKEMELELEKKEE
jgi:long-chain acyl-CoA synthetase